MISEPTCIPIPDARHLVQEDRPDAIIADLVKRLAREVRGGVAAAGHTPLPPCKNFSFR